MYCLIPEYQSPFLMSSAVESSCRCKVASRVSAGVAEGVGTGVGVFLTIEGVGVATAVAAAVRRGSFGGGGVRMGGRGGLSLLGQVGANLGVRLSVDVRTR